MYDKFWIDNDFFVRKLEASVKAPLAQVAFTKDFFFSLPDRVVPFLSSLRLVFSPRTFLRF